MTLPVIVVLAYAAFCIVGGLIGYVKAKSVPSLIAGVLSGLVLGGVGYRMMQGHRSASIGAIMVALLLGGRFFGTWRTKRRVMPDLLMLLLSGLTIIIVGCSLIG